MKTINFQSGIALLLVAAAAPRLAAQPTPTVEQCAQIEAEAERLACYDAIARGAAAADSHDPTDAAEVARQPAQSQQAEPTETRSERRARRRDEQNSEIRRVNIVAVSENFTGFSVFTTDGGEVFVETSATAARYPAAPFEAVLEPASFGSFFLIPESETNRIRVSLQR